MHTLQEMKSTYAGELNWYALAVKSRHEFVAADELRKKGVETFLPSVVKTRQWKDRRKAVEFPLFPGYLFVRIYPQAEEFLKVVKTRGSVTFVSLDPGHPTPVASGEIYSLKMMIENRGHVDIYPHLHEGARVRVKKGPLKGAEGVLAKKEGEYLFLVNIEILGRSVGTKIYAEDIEQA